MHRSIGCAVVASVLGATLFAQSPGRLPPPPGGAFYPPYRPMGPPPFCDRANPPPPGGAFTIGGAVGGSRSGADRSGGSADSTTRRGAPSTEERSEPDPRAAAERRFRAAFSMLRNYASARPPVCREVRTRAEAILKEFGDTMTAEQILEVGSCAVRCDSPSTARTAFQLVIDRFPDTSHATLAEARQRRLPRR